jgi:hypothetical protein
MSLADGEGSREREGEQNDESDDDQGSREAKRIREETIDHGSNGPRTQSNRVVETISSGTGTWGDHFRDRRIENRGGSV